MPKALVIGSEGNIGVPLVKHLRATGYDVMESDIRPGWRKDYLMADINYPVDLLPAFDWGPDVVFILSAMVSRVTCEQAAGLAIATNLGGINNVLQLCRRAGAMTVFFSTSEVYGPECDPMDEAISDPKPNNRYGLSKLLGEHLVEYEVRTHGLR
ncbi:MAG: NAD(P)-dependent oxidoreductase, partial [Rhodospirillales bacterium]|nr:NAD(P)-dependent oxidoreductase [Rhodospirillales bacterium]